MPEMELVAQRSINATNRFIETCMEHHCFSQEQAEHILAVYRKLKIIKIDVVGGGYTLKDGIYYEKDIMQNALTLLTGAA